MAITDSFMATCRAAVRLLPELATFRAALADHDSSSGAQRRAAWNAAYDDQGGASPALLLRQAIRGVVRAEADLAGTLSAPEREVVYRALAAEFVPANARPATRQNEEDELRRALLLDQLS